MTALVRRTQNQGWLPLFFNDIMKEDWKLSASATTPAINVKETETEYCVEVAAAGMAKDDFNVSIDEENDLVITVEKKNETKEEYRDNARYLRREFSYSKFRQTLVLPENVNKEKIEAKVEHGVLYVHLPKFTENEIQKKQRSIAIN
jgi:HSP20 family protein